MSNVFHYREDLKNATKGMTPQLITCRVEFPNETYWFGCKDGNGAICHVCAGEIKRIEMLEHLIDCHPYALIAIRMKDVKATNNEVHYAPSLKLADVFEMDKPIESVADLKSWDQKQLFEHYVIITKMHLAKLASVRDTDVQIALQGKIDWMLDEMKLLYFNK